MIIVEPSVKLLAASQMEEISFSDVADEAGLCLPSGSEGAQLTERAGRVCWKSEGQVTPDSAASFCERVVHQKGHESIMEHASATMHFVTDRYVSHQMVRSRIAAYSQESTHYLNYSKGKFGHKISVCKPWILTGVDSGPGYECWLKSQEQAQAAYFELIEDHGWPHYEARYALPGGLKTEIVATYNFRMWTHVIRQRTLLRNNGKPVNTPEIHYLMLEAGRIMADLCPEMFVQEFG